MYQHIAQSKSGAWVVSMIKGSVTVACASDMSLATAKELARVAAEKKSS